MKNPIKSIASWSSEAKAGVALSLGAVIIFSSAFLLTRGDSGTSSSQDSLSQSSTSLSITSTGNTSTSIVISSNPVVDVMEEEIKRPYSGTPEVVRYYYDASDPVETRTKAIVKVPGATSTYIKSLGNDYAYADGKEFDVLASLSGTVVDKVSDPTYGNVLVIEHKSGIKMVYASLQDCIPNKGDEVKQGDKIARSGTSLYTSEFKSALHFEIIKDDKYVNPEKTYSSAIKEL